MLYWNLKSWWYKRIAAKKRTDKKKKTTHYTMMVVPHGHGAAVKNYCFPMWLVKSFMAVSISCILIVGYFATGFFYLRYVAVENKELKEINIAQAKELKELQGLAGNMRNKLEALIKLDQEVRSKIGMGNSSMDEKSARIESSRAESRYQFITMGLGGPGQGVSQLSTTGIMVPYQGDNGSMGVFTEGSTSQVAEENSSVLELPILDESDNTLEALKEQLAQMDVFMSQQTDNMNKLSSELDRQKAVQGATPDFWPYSGRITSTFGWRKNPFSKGGSEFHDGVDIAGPYGSPIRAAGDGIVTFAGYKGSWGRLVVISHGYGYVTQYAHNSSLVVKTGDRVKKGQVISRLGNTGRSTGAHLHYGVAYKGKWINPFNVIKR